MFGFGYTFNHAKVIRMSCFTPEQAVESLVVSNPINPEPYPELNPELDSIRVYLNSIIAFVNPKSGGQKGRIVLEILKNYLPKANVFDLTKGGPEASLEMHKEKKDLKIIACGGDGTAGWVLSALDEIDFGENSPAVSIIPLGTGNDLARTFGWGGGYVDESIRDILEKVINGCVIKMDRWSIKTESQLESNSLTAASDEAKIQRISGIPVSAVRTARDIKAPNTSVAEKRADAKLPLSCLNNYFSIGVDSKIALEFHRARIEHPEQFNSQMSNKIQYAKVS